MDELLSGLNPRGDRRLIKDLIDVNQARDVTQITSKLYRALDIAINRTALDAEVRHQIHEDVLMAACDIRRHYTPDLWGVNALEQASLIGDRVLTRLAEDGPSLFPD